jgi:hypothetical protein
VLYGVYLPVVLREAVLRFDRTLCGVY